MMAFLRRLYTRSAQPSPEKQAERDAKDRIIEVVRRQNEIDRVNMKQEAQNYVSTLNEAMWIIGGGRR